jgi:serine/threonine-protein kinase RsbW
MVEEYLKGSEQTVVFPGTYDSLTGIVDFVTAAAKKAGLDMRGVHAVQLAVDEACSNIIQHAYGGEGRGYIKCTCCIDSDGLTMTLTDHGASFDPDSVPEPDLQGDLECRAEGGLGVYIMRQLMDEVRYEFTPDAGNVLTMVKHREKPGE